MRKGNFVLGASALGVSIVAILVAVMLCTTTVAPGYEGLIYNRNGGIEQETLGQGWHTVAPWKKVIEYPVSTETVYMSSDEREGSEDDESYSVPTKDGKQISVGSEFNYSYMSEKLSEVFTKFRGRKPRDIERSFMRGKIKAWTGEVTSKYTVIELYGEKRAQASKEVAELMKTRFADWGIEAENFNLIEVIPDPDTMKAIQKVINDRQALEQEKVLNDKAIIKQARLATEAENKRIEAEGNKQEKIINAQGEAEANRLMQSTLNDNLVKMEWINKWDGHMPTVQGANSIMQMPMGN